MNAENGGSALKRHPLLLACSISRLQVSSPAAKAGALQTTSREERALVRATLALRSSATKPRPQLPPPEFLLPSLSPPPLLELLTADTITTSFSLPWNPSTVPTSTGDRAEAVERNGRREDEREEEEDGAFLPFAAAPPPPT